MQETPKSPDVSLSLNAAGVAVPARHKPGTGSALVVLLHGAVNRERREVPFLQAFLGDLPGAHQLAVSDPGMMRFETLAATWYLGWEGRRLWEDLNRAILDFSASVGCTSRIYVGGSSGGFAALLLSHGDPGSVAIACNPQTNLFNHVYKRAMDRYQAVAWPETLKAGRLAEEAPFDLGALYAGGFANRFVYVQSAGDFPHLHRQAVPFLGTLPEGSDMDVAIDVGFHGVQGHGASIPSAVTTEWLRAVLAVEPETERWAELVLETRHALRGRSGARGRDRPARQNAKGFDMADLRMADRIAAIELGRRVR